MDAKNVEKPRYKNQVFEKAYRQLLSQATDEQSSLYLHRNPMYDSFWKGYTGGTKPHWIVPNTLQAVAYQAGKEHAKRKKVQDKFYQANAMRMISAAIREVKSN